MYWWSVLDKARTRHLPGIIVVRVSWLEHPIPVSVDRSWEREPVDISFILFFVHFIYHDVYLFAQLLLIAAKNGVRFVEEMSSCFLHMSG